MIQTVVTDHVACGMWKFRDSIPENTLIVLATQWKTEDEDRYYQLYVRKCSKDQNAIGFIYDYGGGKENYDKFFSRITDNLKRMFGNDFVGWDVASSVHRVK